MTRSPFHGPFGPWLKQRRKELDLTQAHLAALLHCSRSAIEKLEAHERKPSPAIAERLAQILKLPPEQWPAFVRWARQSEAPSATPPPSNLRIPPIPCLGREQETATLLQVLRDPTVRLLTLTGVGGVGKTRLALHVLAILQQDYPDGVWVVDLAPLTRPEQLEQQIAQTLAIPEVPGQSIQQTLLAALATRTLLLVLDNFEHLTDAASLLEAYLTAAPSLTILVTSRVPLHLAVEHDYSVPPLAVPPHRRTLSLPVLAQYPAIAVFLRFALAAEPTFTLTPATAPVITELCQRLDGLPLALELAAARLRLFSPDTLLARLNQSSNILSRHVPDQPIRQQTLHGMVDWSYRLLPAAAQRVFLELGVFRGGWTMAAAEAVCTGNAEQPGLVFDTMTLLLDAHLIHDDPAANEGEPRFTMLETVREFATEELAKLPEYETVWERYVAYFEEFVATAKPYLEGPEQGVWLKRLSYEIVNIQESLERLLTHHEVTRTATVAINLWIFWRYRGLVNEGQFWYQRIASTSNHLDNYATMDIYYRIGGFAFFQRNLDLAEEFCLKSLELAQQYNRSFMSAPLGFLGAVAKNKQDYTKSLEFFNQAYEIAQQSNNIQHIISALSNRAALKGYLGSIQESINDYQKCLVLEKEVGNIHGIGASLNHLSLQYLRLGEYTQCHAAVQESINSYSQIGYTKGVVCVQCTYGLSHMIQGHFKEAYHILIQGCIEEHKHHFANSIGDNLDGLAAIIHIHDDSVFAAHLWGFSDAYRQQHSQPRAPVDRPRHDGIVQMIRANLTPEEYETAYHRGQQMEFAEVVELITRWKPANGWKTVAPTWPWVIHEDRP